MDAKSPAAGNAIQAGKPVAWRPDRCDRVALVLQGGGALGAYQGGVYQALHEAGLEPDWVSGVSIGAINAAIIAGNPPERRLEQLRAFWERITERRVWFWMPEGDIYRQAHNAMNAALTYLFGVTGFFKPHVPGPLFSPAGAPTATSFYDTTPLKETLLEFVDFSLINAQKLRFAVGAVNVLTGNFTYFDNAHEEISVEHIVASGSLPPMLPMEKVGSEYFWDGGVVSNTPLQHLLDQSDHLNSLVFQVDLYSARGALPRDIFDVLERHKDIMYSSRTRYNTDFYRQLHEWKTRLHAVLEKVPDEFLTDEERYLRHQLSDMPEITILQLIYQQKAYEGHAKDYEFSDTSMLDHWTSGHEDTHNTLRQRAWLEMPPPGAGIVVHDVHHKYIA